MISLVTGGTGFVGSHLIERLRSNGDDVRALVRRGSNRAAVEALGAEAVIGDLDDADSLVAAARGCDVIYHAAARVEIVGSEEEFFNTTVAGTQRLVDAANACGVKRFVYVSSCGVYHPKLLASGQDIDESTPTPEPPRWFMYGRAKFNAEKVVRERLSPSLEWVVIRLGYLYGPRNRTMHSYLAPVFREKIMTIIGRGDNEMAVVYVGDAVNAIALAGRCPGAANRILIAGGNETITQRQYFDAMADGFRVPRVSQRVPYAVAFFFGWLGEFVAFGTRKLVMRRSAVALTGLPQLLRCQTTQQLLGWRPEVKFSDGIRRAFDWYWSEYGEPQAVPGTQPATQASFL